MKQKTYSISLRLCNHFIIAISLCINQYAAYTLNGIQIKI